MRNLDKCAFASVISGEHGINLKVSKAWKKAEVRFNSEPPPFPREASALKLEPYHHSFQWKSTVVWYHVWYSDVGSDHPVKTPSHKPIAPVVNFVYQDYCSREDV